MEGRPIQEGQRQRQLLDKQIQLLETELDTQQDGMSALHVRPLTDSAGGNTPSKDSWKREMKELESSLLRGQLTLKGFEAKVAELKELRPQEHAAVLSRASVANTENKPTKLSNSSLSSNATSKHSRLSTVSLSSKPDDRYTSSSPGQLRTAP